MTLTYTDLVKHFEKLKSEGWTREQCQEGGLELDSDQEVDGGQQTESRALEFVFGN